MTGSASASRSVVGPIVAGGVAAEIVLVDVPRPIAEYIGRVFAGSSATTSGASSTSREQIVVTTRSEGRQDPIRLIEAHHGSELVASDVDPRDVIEAVLSRLDFWAFDSQPDRLHLHAACVVSRHGEAVLIVGESGAGKSSLSALLALDGWGYVTDEVVALDEDGRVTGFCRPVALKPGGWQTFETSLVDPPVARRGAMDRVRRWSRPMSVAALWKENPPHLKAPLQPRVRFIPAESLPKPTGPGPWTVGAVIFCEREGAAESPVLEPISGAVAVSRMLAQTFDAGRLRDDAIARLVRVASGAETAVARYTNGATLRTPLDVLLNEREPPRSAPEPVPSVVVPAPRGPSRLPAASTWLVGGDLVVATPGGERVIALSGSAVRLWGLLDGALTVEELVTEFGTAYDAAHESVDSSVRAAIADMIGAGLVQPSGETEL